MTSKIECPNIERETMTIQETAKFLGISINHCYDMLAADQIPHQRLGKKIIIGRTALMNWLEKKED